MRDLHRPDRQQTVLDIILNDAVITKTIESYTLRPNGRATIYLVGDEDKIYTTSTLNTLAALDNIKKGIEA